MGWYLDLVLGEEAEALEEERGEAGEEEDALVEEEGADGGQLELAEMRDEVLPRRLQPRRRHHPTLTPASDCRRRGRGIRGSPFSLHSALPSFLLKRRRRIPFPLYGRPDLISSLILLFSIFLYSIERVREKEKGKKKVGPRWQVSSRGPALSCCWPVLIAILQLATIHPLPIYCSGVSLYYI